MLTLARAALLAVPAPPQKADLIDWECQFGRIQQTGKNVVVAGDAWNATGSVRPDGSVILFWLGSSERVAIGVYRRDGDNLVGHWGWADEVEITDAGDICRLDGEALSNETLAKRDAKQQD